MIKKTKRSEKLNFVIIDSREGLGLKQDYYDTNNSSMNVKSKNSDNINRDCYTDSNTYNDNIGNNDNNDHRNDIEDINNNDIMNNNNVYQNNSNNNNNNDNIIKNTNHKISEISSYALFTDFKNIINCCIKDEKKNFIANHLPTTYSNYKNETLFYLKENIQSELSCLDSNTSILNSLNIDRNKLSKVTTNISNITSNNLNPYSEAKKILFTDFRFFQDWVRKKDFTSH